MRIGFDVSATCNEKTGCTWYADSLIRAMVQHHPEHQYALYRNFGQIYSENAAKGTTIDGENVTHYYGDISALESKRVWREISNGESPSGQPDIVQANFMDCPRITTVPVVYVVYDLSFWMCPEFLTSNHLISCTKGLCEGLANATGFIFISEHTLKDFERHFPGWLNRNQKPHRVIHLAARTSEAKAATPAVFGQNYWLYVGTIEPRKNLLTLLQAHDLYFRQSPSPRKLMLAGGRGWCSEHIHREIALREERGSVQYLGYVDETQMESLYANALAMLYPSYYEGFGLPILEAMNRGVPVICSQATSHPEVGGDAVEYFDPWQPAELAGKMLEFERDNARQKHLAEAGKARAGLFSWQKVADETLRFYQEVLESGKRNPT